MESFWFDEEEDTQKTRMNARQQGVAPPKGLNDVSKFWFDEPEPPPKEPTASVSTQENFRLARGNEGQPQLPGAIQSAEVFAKKAAGAIPGLLAEIGSQSKPTDIASVLGQSPSMGSMNPQESVARTREYLTKRAESDPTKGLVEQLAVSPQEEQKHPVSSFLGGVAGYAPLALVGPAAGLEGALAERIGTGAVASAVENAPINAMSSMGAENPISDFAQKEAFAAAAGAAIHGVFGREAGDAHSVVSSRALDAEGTGILQALEKDAVQAEQSIASQAVKKNPNTWTAAEEELVSKYYNQGNNRTLSELTGRTPPAIRGKAQRLGLVEGRVQPDLSIAPGGEVTASGLFPRKPTISMEAPGAEGFPSGAAAEGTFLGSAPITRTGTESNAILPVLSDAEASSALRNSPFERGAAAAQEAQPPGTVRVYHGEGGAKGGGSTGDFFSTDPERAGSYGPNLSYVDVPEDVFAQGQAAARDAGSGTPGDVILPPEYVNSARPSGQAVAEPTYLSEADAGLTGDPEVDAAMAQLRQGPGGAQAPSAGPQGPPGVTQGYNVPLGATSNAPGSLRAALEASITKETGQESPAVVAKALEAVSPIDPGGGLTATATASLYGAKERAFFLKSIAEDPELAELPKNGEMTSGMNPFSALKGAFDFWTSQKFRDWYVGGTLLTGGPQLANFLQNTLNMAALPFVRAIEAGIATPMRAANNASRFFKMGRVFENPGSASFAESIALFKGYATGVKNFDESVRGIGQLYRAKLEAGGTLSEVEINNLKGMLSADSTQYAEGWLNYVYAARSIFSDKKVTNEALLPESLKNTGITTIEKAKGEGGLEGGFGNVVRSGTTALELSDAGFKNAVFYGEKAAMVHRMAIKHGVDAEFILGPPARGAKAELWKSIQNEIEEAAANQARYQTFTNELGPTLKAGLSLRDSMGPAGTMLMPFYTTPFNAAKFVIHHSPYNLAEVAFRQTLSGAPHSVDKAIENVSRGVFGTILMGTVWKMMAEGIIGDDTKPNEAYVGVSGSSETGAAGRTEEVAHGGVRTGFTFRIGDTHFDLRRLGLAGSLTGVTVDMLNRYTQLQEDRMKREEAMDESGAWDDRQQAWNEVLSGGATLGKLSMEGLSSSLANNLMNETALTDGLDMITQISQIAKRGDENAMAAMSERLATMVARGVQPFSPLAAAASAEDRVSRSPHPDETFLGQVAQGVDKRIPGSLFDVGPSVSRYEPVAQRDVFGEERKQRFLGDQQGYGLRLASKLFFPYGGASEKTGDPDRDRNREFAREMERVGVTRDFPRLTDKMKDLFPDSDTLEHVQMVRGEWRAYALENLFSQYGDEYAAADDKIKAKTLKHQLDEADSRSATVIENLVLQQQSKGRQLDLRELDAGIIEALDLAFKPRPEKQPEFFQLHQRR